jgi:hypothetical protein
MGLQQVHLKSFAKARLIPSLVDYDLCARSRMPTEALAFAAQGG